jgi:hypothetical protein
MSRSLTGHQLVVHSTIELPSIIPSLGLRSNNAHGKFPEPREALTHSVPVGDDDLGVNVKRSIHRIGENLATAEMAD